MKYTVFDVETDGLLETVTKIHCLSYQIIENGKRVEKGSITDYEQIKSFIAEQVILVGHNIIKYDIPVLEKILDIKVESRLVDTLPLSWYLYPLRGKHGLELWGDELGVPKPAISDWQNLDIADYIHRCESDVEINKLLYFRQLDYLNKIYEQDIEQINNLINYLSFKMDCAREQEEVRCKIDLNLVNNSLAELKRLREEKVEALVEAMPKNLTYKEVNKPSKMYKKDDTLSKAGIKWLDLLHENNLPVDYEQPVRVLVSEEDGNPGSHTQLKSWLFSLGWEPQVFEYRKNKAGEVKPVPQIYLDDEVCSSIRLLYEAEPALENLDMLSLINHRIGIFESYLENTDETGYTTAQVHGLTNTLRFRHKKPIVNLPKVFKFYGEQIRGAIVKPDNQHILCGSDMSSLEDSTKQHYMYFFDPDYVTQMRVPGFDPHVDIAVFAELMTKEEEITFKTLKKKKELTHDEHEIFSYLSKVRGNAKVVNFSAVYGAGPPKIAQTLGCELAFAQKLHKAYWERNKAVKQVARACQVKKIGDQMWLRNPVSNFWYTLRYEKDRFSTLNQGRICSE